MNNKRVFSVRTYRYRDTVTVWMGDQYGSPLRSRTIFLNFNWFGFYPATERIQRAVERLQRHADRLNHREMYISHDLEKLERP